MGRHFDRGGSRRERERSKRKTKLHELRRDEYDAEARAARKAALAGVARKANVTPPPPPLAITPRAPLWRRLFSAILFWRK